MSKIIGATVGTPISPKSLHKKLTEEICNVEYILTNCTMSAYPSTVAKGGTMPIEITACDNHLLKRLKIINGSAVTEKSYEEGVDEYALLTPMTVQGDVVIIAEAEVEIKVSGGNVDQASEYFLLKSPSGTVYKVTVTDEGILKVMGETDIDLPDLIPGRLLVWHDEFDSTEIDRTKWRSSTNASQTTELAAYTYERSENAYIEDGQLVLRGLRDGYVSGYEWTSARLDTLGLFGVKYGRIEAKLKYESKNGAFPAFWTLGCNTHYPSGENGPYGVTKSLGAPWPYCGELDIFEGVNGEGGVHPVIHYSLNPEESTQTTKYIAQNSTVDTSEYHIYGVEWTENSMSAYLDNVKIGEIDTTGLPPYNKPHYIILNLCIGSIAGSPDDEVDEIKMHVDWVRVYAPENVTEKLDISGVALSRESVTMNIGDTAQYVDYSSTPAGTVNSLVTLTSSNPSVFTVYGTKLTAVAVGDAELIATSYNGIVSRIPVHIRSNAPIYADSVSLNTNQFSVLEGNTYQLIATVTPTNYSDEFVWESSDNSVATVNNGLVTGVAAGNCTITVYSQNNNSVRASCEITVEELITLDIPKNGLVLQLDKNGMSSYAWRNSVDGAELPWANAYNHKTGADSAVILADNAFYFTGENYAKYSLLDISEYYSHSANQTLIISFDPTENKDTQDFIACSKEIGGANSVRIGTNGTVQYFDSNKASILAVDGAGRVNQTMCLRYSDGTVTRDTMTTDGTVTTRTGSIGVEGYEGDGVFTLGVNKGKGELVRYKVCAVYDRVLTDDEVSTVLTSVNDFVSN